MMREWYTGCIRGFADPTQWRGEPFDRPRCLLGSQSFQRPPGPVIGYAAPLVLAMATMRRARTPALDRLAQPKCDVPLHCRAS